LIDIPFCFDLGCFFSVGRFALRQQPDLERFRQFARADVSGSCEDDQLLGLTVFVARDSRLNRIDLKHRRYGSDPEFLLNCLPRLRAALRGANTFCHRQLEKIVMVRKHDGGAVHVGDATMQTIGGSEMRRRVVRWKDV